VSDDQAQVTEARARHEAAVAEARHRRREEVLRLMKLVDAASDLGQLRDELGEDGFDSIWYDDDPVAAYKRRIAWMQAAALGAIAFLLLRRDEEMWEAWQRY
jgi:hypothetical protein